MNWGGEHEFGDLFGKLFSLMMLRGLVILFSLTRKNYNEGWEKYVEVVFLRNPIWQKKCEFEKNPQSKPKGLVLVLKLMAPQIALYKVHRFEGEFKEEKLGEVFEDLEAGGEGVREVVFGLLSRVGHSLLDKKICLVFRADRVELFPQKKERYRTGKGKEFPVIFGFMTKLFYIGWTDVYREEGKNIRNKLELLELRDVVQEILWGERRVGFEDFLGKESVGRWYAEVLIGKTYF